MNLRTKKLIAREFLLVLGCLLISAAFVGSVSLYTIWIEHNINEAWSLIHDTKKIEDELRSGYTTKFNERNELMKSIKEVFYFGDISNNELWERTLHHYKTDSIDYKWKYVWGNDFKSVLINKGINSAQDFKIFIKDHSISKTDIINKEKADLLLDERYAMRSNYNSLKAKLPVTSLSKFYFIGLSITAIVIFPIRFFIIAIIWSFKTLRKKE